MIMTRPDRHGRRRGRTFYARWIVVGMMTLIGIDRCVHGVNDGAVDLDTFDFSAYEDDGIDYVGCVQDLGQADTNPRDGLIKESEYGAFLQTHIQRICGATAYASDTISLKQKASFVTMACQCQSMDNASSDCCVGDNASLYLATGMQKEDHMVQYLAAICRITDRIVREEPRNGCPVITSSSTNDSDGGGDGGGGDGGAPPADASSACESKCTRLKLKRIQCYQNCISSLETESSSMTKICQRLCYTSTVRQTIRQCYKDCNNQADKNDINNND